MSVYVYDFDLAKNARVTGTLVSVRSRPWLPSHFKTGREFPLSVPQNVIVNVDTHIITYPVTVKITRFAVGYGMWQWEKGLAFTDSERSRYMAEAEFIAREVELSSTTSSTGLVRVKRAPSKARKVIRRALVLLAEAILNKVLGPEQ